MAQILVENNHTHFVTSWFLEVLWCLCTWDLTCQSLRGSFWALMMVLTHFTVLGCHLQWKESSWSQDLWIQILKSLLRRVSGSIGIVVLFVIFEYIWTLHNIWERLKGGQHSPVFSCNEPWKILGLGSKSQSTETPFPTAGCLMMTHSWKGPHKFPGSITPLLLGPIHCRFKASPSASIWMM